MDPLGALPSLRPPQLNERVCGMGGEGWPIPDEMEFANNDSSTTSKTLFRRNYIPEGTTDADAEAGLLEPHRRREEDQGNHLIGIMGVTGAGKSPFIRAGQEEYESKVIQLDGSGIRGYSTLLVLKRLMSAIQEYETSFDRFDGSSVPIHQTPAPKNGPVYHLETYPDSILDEAGLNLFPSSESPSQPRNGGGKIGDSFIVCDAGCGTVDLIAHKSIGSLGSCIHKTRCESPEICKRIRMKETYPDTIHPPDKPYRRRFDLKRTVTVPAALVSLACAFCMHNYNANRHDQSAGYLMRPIPIWSAIDNPSPPMLVAATMTHGIATLAYYALRPGDRFRESFLGIGLVSAGAVGYGIGADTESVLVGILPLVTTMSLLICTLTNLLLKGCGVGSSFGEGRERDLEKQSRK